MSWEKEVDELTQKRALAQAQGGEEGVARQHARGLLTIRERIDAMLDDGSFQELGGASGDATRDEDGRLTSASRRPTSCSASARSTGAAA